MRQDQLFHQGTAGAPDARRDERSLDTRVDYGLPLPAGGLLTPFGIYGQSQYGRRLQVGLLLSRLGPLGLEVSSERYALPPKARGGDSLILIVAVEVPLDGPRGRP